MGCEVVSELEGQRVCAGGVGAESEHRPWSVLSTAGLWWREIGWSSPWVAAARAEIDALPGQKGMEAALPRSQGSG